MTSVVGPGVASIRRLSRSGLVGRHSGYSGSTGGAEPSQLDPTAGSAGRRSLSLPDHPLVRRSYIGTIFSSQNSRRTRATAALVTLA